MNSELWITLAGGLGAAKLLEIVLTRFFTRAEKKQDGNTTIEIKQLDDGADRRRELQQEVTAMRADVKELQEKLLTFAQSNSQERAEKTILAALHKAAEENLSKLQINYDKLQSNYDELKAKYEELQQKLIDSNEENRNLKLDMQQLRIEFDSFKTQQEQKPC